LLRETARVNFDPTVEAHIRLGVDPRLRVDDPVRREILRAFGGDPDDRVALLEHPDGVLERLQVELERLPIRASPEPCREIVRVRRGQRVVAELGRQVDDRPGSEAAVEVVVEDHLRRVADRVQLEQSSHLLPGRRWYRRRRLISHPTDGSSPRTRL